MKVSYNKPANLMEKKRKMLCDERKINSVWTHMYKETLSIKIHVFQVTLFHALATFEYRISISQKENIHI